MKLPNFTHFLNASAEWVTENPGKAALYGFAGTAMTVPAVISGPALVATGFGGFGAVPASVASGYQAAIGNVAAGSVFATLQSAGMGGYGVAIVNGAVQAGGAIVGATTALMDFTKNKEDEGKEIEGKDDEGKDDANEQHKKD
ncbi:hypothetical protein GGR53DRAFT_140597 [Hypoxylon sp. FL1150]|nr:hypothetical protein GGR53DRAFT_140597 [Hypoxylon sp. FL1150]